MINTNNTFTLVLLFVMIIIALISCNHDKREQALNNDTIKVKDKTTPTKPTPPEIDGYVNISDAPEYMYLHSRMEYAKFQNIVSDGEQTSMIDISYSEYKFFPGGDPLTARTLDFGAGYADYPQFYSSLNSYRVSYHFRDVASPEIPDVDLFEELSSSLVEDIFRIYQSSRKQNIFF